MIVPGKLSSNIIHIKVGDALNTEELLLKLSDYGFERTDFVYEPGQFAIRGGILDIYSFGNDKPYGLSYLEMMWIPFALLIQKRN